MQFTEHVAVVDGVPAEGTHGLPLDPIIKMKPSREVTGSGFAIGGRRILTNAHVVANATFVTVRKFGSPLKIPARVVALGHDCDLAMLEVDDDGFWEGLYPLPLGDLPDTVQVIGYPTGGDTISVTRGVVSRIEPQQYAHGASSLLAIQIDAAINPGNSGGPVLDENNKVAGVAFQTLTGTEGIGFIIPVPVIKHFLEDIRRNGRYVGFGSLGVLCQAMDNPHIRRAYGMRDTDMQSGVLIIHTMPLTHANTVLQKDDVLLKVAGIQIGNDGTIPFRKRARIFFDYLFLYRFVGDPLPLEILRSKERKEVEVKLSLYRPLVPVHSYDRLPSYYIWAGLVFSPLVQPYLHEWGEDWFNTCPRKLQMKAINEIRQYEDEEIVVLSYILVEEINYGYSPLVNFQVLAVNGQKIRNLRHLKQLVEQSTEEYMRFDLDDHAVIVINAKEAQLHGPRILEKHRVPRPYSEDLE